MSGNMNMRLRVVALLLMGLLLIASSACGDPRPNDKLVETTGGGVTVGTVAYEDIDESAPVVLKTGTGLLTKPDGRATILFGDEASILMDFNTEIVIRRPSEDYLFELKKGMAYIYSLGDGIKDIDIPGYGKVSLTGTELRISVTPDEAKIAVREGQAAFVSLSEQTINISANREQRLEPEGQPIEQVAAFFSQEEVGIFHNLEKAVYLTKLSNLSIEPPEVEPNQTVNISVTVTNIGNIQGSHDVILNINGAQEAVESVTINPGSSQIVFFGVSREDPGSYEVTIGSLSGSFTVMIF